MPRPLCPSLSALLIAGIFVAPPAPAAADQRDLDLGREAVSRQDYAAAVPALRRAVAALDPERDRAAFADAWLQLGLAYLLGPGGDPEQALAAFLASAAAAPNPASAYLWAGTAAERLGRRDEAETFKARALAGPAPAPEPEPEIARQPQPALAPARTEAAPPAAEERTQAEAETKVEKGGDGEASNQPGEREAGEAKPAEPAAGAAFEHFFGRRRGPSPGAKEGAASQPGEEQRPAEAEPDPERPPSS